MSSFQQVSRDEFDRVLEKSKASSTFREQFARYEPQYYEGANGPDCMVHLGPLKMNGHFEAPGFFTLVTGDLHVDGTIDLQNSYDKGFDEGGLFIVLGDVVCHSFFNEYGKCTFVDGRLEARDLLVNAFEDSALVVIFFGEDLWAEVGGNATMEYGYGYCLPIGYADSVDEQLLPKHGRERSLLLLNFERTKALHPKDFRDHLRTGKPLLKRV
jgi:hypothetical protein